MTDEDMHRRLSAAGARWRDGRPDAARVSTVPRIGPTGTALTPGPAPRRRWGLYASAVAVAAVLVAGALVAVTGLGGHDRRTNGADTAGLTGTVWRLTDGRMPSAATVSVDKSGVLVADDECTVVGAHVDRHGGRLAASKVQVRHRDCVDQTGLPLGDRFVEALESTPRFTVHDTQLRIGAYRFVAAAGMPRPVLDVPTFEEARWNLVGIEDATGTTVPTPPKAYLRVHDGRLTGRDGCNFLGGQVTRIGTTVRAKKGSGAATAMDCSPHRPGTAVVDQVLSAPFRATVRGVVLTVTKKGAGTLTYEWVPENPAEFDPANLTGTTWRLTDVAGDPAIGHATLRFPSATAYEANDGCRTFRGTATAATGITRLAGVPHSTAKCGKAERNQAGTVDSFLGTHPLFAIREGTLIVYGGGAQSFALVYARCATSRTC